MTREVNGIYDDEIMELLKTPKNDINSKTIKERFDGIQIDCYNYLKHDGDKNKKGAFKSGTALETNQARNFVAVDVDINKEYDDVQREVIRDSILEKLNENDIIVKTASGGLHIYCNIDDAYLPKNRRVGYYKSEDFNIDLIGGVDEKKRSLLVLPESKYRADKKKGTPTLTYEFIQGDWDSVIKRSLIDVLNDLEIPATVDETPEVKSIVKEFCGETPKNHSPNYVPQNNGVEMDDDLMNAVLLGLDGIEVHRDAKPIKEEVTLFTLFQALNALPRNMIEDTYDYVKGCCNLTPNAQKSFDYAKKRYSLVKSSTWVLVTIIKYHNKDYYDEELHDKLVKFNKQHIGFRNISLHDDFYFNDIRIKAENNEYHTYEQVIEDLSRVIRFMDNGTFFVKTSHPYNDGNGDCTDYWTVDSIQRTQMESNLRKEIWTEGKTKITLNHAFMSAQSRFNIKGKTFLSKDPLYLSLFQGLKYDIKLYDSDRYNKVSERVKKDPLSLIQPFLDLVYDVIAFSDTESYEYILNWISYIVQNPGKKTGIALVLKGLQGVGKNTFTDVLSRMFIGYSEPNVSKLDSIAGKFNAAVEGKILLVLNEMRNSGENQSNEFDSLKTIVTDYVFMLNQKCQAERPAENVSNLIFVTNNPFPVRVELGDRRYAVFSCDDKYMDNKDEHFKKLKQVFSTDEFYEALTLFFMDRDISGFKVSKSIPNTRARDELIRASMTTSQQWVCKYYNTLVEKGMIMGDALLLKPDELKPKSFRIYFTDACYTNDKPDEVDDEDRRYFLRNDYAKVFKNYAWYRTLESERNKIQQLTYLDRD